MRACVVWNPNLWCSAGERVWYMNMLMVIWICIPKLNMWYHETCIYERYATCPDASCYVMFMWNVWCPIFTSQWWAGRDRSLVDGSWFDASPWLSKASWSYSCFESHHFGSFHCSDWIFAHWVLQFRLLLCHFTGRVDFEPKISWVILHLQTQLSLFCITSSITWDEYIARSTLCVLRFRVSEQISQLVDAQTALLDLVRDHGITVHAYPTKADRGDWEWTLDLSCKTCLD